MSRVILIVLAILALAALVFAALGAVTSYALGLLGFEAHWWPCALLLAVWAAIRGVGDARDGIGEKK